MVAGALQSQLWALSRLMFQRHEVSVAASSPSSTGLAGILWLVVRQGHLGYPGPGNVLTVLLQDMREIGRFLPVGSEK